MIYFTKAEHQMMFKLLNNKIVQLQSERASTIKYGDMNHPKDREEIEKIDKDLQIAENLFNKIKEALV